jgi:hypothetical protein
VTISRNYCEPEHADDEECLTQILEQRDERGGGEFWLANDGDRFPCLAVVVAGAMSFIHYFPEDGHPGFRCTLPPGRSDAVERQPDVPPIA